MESDLCWLIVLVLLGMILLCCAAMDRDARRQLRAAQARAKKLEGAAAQADTYLQQRRQAWLLLNARDELIDEMSKALRSKDVLLAQYRKQLERQEVTDDAV